MKSRRVLVPVAHLSIFVFLAALDLVAPGYTIASDSGVPSMPAAPMDESPAGRAADALAASLAQRAADQAQCAALATELTTSEILDRLDAAPARDMLSPIQWRLHRVLGALAANSSPQARDALGRLCVHPLFQDDSGRAELLIRALAAVHPLPEASTAFLREQLAPEGVNLQVAIVSLWQNRDSSALALLEEVFADKRHDDAYVTSWMREGFVLYRGELEVVRLAARLLAPDRLDPARRDRLVEALYVTDAGILFPTSDNRPVPPTPAQIPAGTRQALIALANQLLDTHAVSASRETDLRSAIAALAAIR